MISIELTFRMDIAKSEIKIESLLCVLQPWPVSESITALTTTIAYDGPYSFVHDIHCNLNQPIISYFQVMITEKNYLNLSSFFLLQSYGCP